MIKVEYGSATVKVYEEQSGESSALADAVRALQRVAIAFSRQDIANQLTTIKHEVEHPADEPLTYAPEPDPQFRQDALDLLRQAAVENQFGTLEVEMLVNVGDDMRASKIPLKHAEQRVHEAAGAYWDPAESWQGWDLLLTNDDKPRNNWQTPPLVWLKVKAPENWQQARANGGR